MKILLAGLIGLTMLLGSCAPKVTTFVTKTYPPANPRQRVMVYGLREPVPEKAEQLGGLKIGDTGFSMDCSLETVIAKAQEEARKVGGNALKITSHTPPDLFSSCHRISAVILRVEGPESLLTAGPARDTAGVSSSGPGLVRNGDTAYRETPADRVLFVKRKFPHFRAAVNGGWSYRTAKIASNAPTVIKDYLKGLKSGWQYAGDATWYFTEGVGVGFRYSCHRSTNHLYNVIVTLNDGSTRTGTMSDDISINFLGPYFSGRLFSANRKNCFLANIGIGYTGYKDKAVLITPFTIKGNTAGLFFDIGYDIGLTKELALGLQVSYYMGSLSEYDLYDGTQSKHVTLEKGSYEGLMRADLSIGLRFVK
ncbi:MAG TPA: hypothetical protein PKG48_07190 [Bacteroidales bacterium]|nr:hypothetical protein [Bacteroidales bacterium]